MAEFLLELLSEEIPARMQTRAADDLKRLVADGLKAAGLGFTDARAFATPRRLAFVVDGLPASRPDVSEERRGPRVGAPDQAVQGFLKGAGLASLDQAEKRDTGKGEFWFAVLKKKGGPTADVLPGIIEAALKALPWPKSMKWGSGTLQWVRPLQGIVALFDGKVLAGEIAPGGQMAPVTFGDITRGHRFLGTGEFRVAGFADYVAKLRAAHVVLDPAERKKIILDGARKLTGEAQVALKHDDGLLEEVAGLVEWPVPMLGTIDAQFMDVPPEVLTVSMKTHQRYFVTTKSDGTLANRFVVVANNVARDGGKTIVEGNERVLRSRLSDAKFFWDQDRKVTLEERLPTLKGIVFHAKLGTQAERVERITALTRQLSRFIPEADGALAARAAMLCKADLVTGMVGEFPELQGTMGRYYALHDNLLDEIADAIGDQYLPASPSDRCPNAPLSIAVALADKLDTLVAFWSIGEKPTGSRDPFGLRRAALGSIRIVVENNLRIGLSAIVARHFKTLMLKHSSIAHKITTYLDSEKRIFSEERELQSLITSSPFRSYLDEGGLLKTVSALFGKGSEFQADFYDSPAMDLLYDRAKDIELAAGLPDRVRDGMRELQRSRLGRDRRMVAEEEPADAYVSRIEKYALDFGYEIVAFFTERLKVQMREKGVRHDVVDAVFALGNEDDLVRLLARVEALQSFLGTEAGKNLLTAYGRAANIVRAEEKKDKALAAKIAGAPDVALLEQVEEKAVATALADVERTVKPALEKEDFAGAMQAFAGLRVPIDAFFDKVTVNVQDKPELRLNRLKLLNQIRATMDSVADFSKVEG